MNNAITITENGTPVAAVTLDELAAIINALPYTPTTTEPETAPVDAERDAVRREYPAATEEEIDRVIAQRQKRAARAAADTAALAAVSALVAGQVVRTTDDGYWIVESKGTRTTWGEFGDGAHGQTVQTVTVSKCRANGARLKTRQNEVVEAASFGRMLQ